MSSRYCTFISIDQESQLKKKKKKKKRVTTPFKDTVFSNCISTSLSPDDNNVGQQTVLPVLRFPVDIQEDTIRVLSCVLPSVFILFVDTPTQVLEH